MKNLVLVSILFFAIFATPKSTFAQPSYRFQAGLNSSPGSLDNLESILATPLYSGKALILKPIHAVTAMATEKCRQLQFKYAKLMSSNIESITNLSLFGVIDQWFGTRYRFGGESKKGIDCSALTGLLMSCVYAVKMPRTAREQYEETDRVSREDLQEGDLVFFNTRKGVRVSHVGMYLRDGYFVHASSSQGVTISSLDEGYFSTRYIGAGRQVQNINMMAGLN
ncbi:MAG: C40 family peptidase [Ferruginibacter sp.]